jgi:TonB-dependent SusC/RagA subfamily outer membrane receptor
MNHLIAYVLKVILCSAIFFAYYLLALRNKNFHPYNRFYLLTTAVISAFLPLLHISMFDFTSDNARMLALFQLMGSGQLPTVVIGNAPKAIDWEQIGLIVSLSVTFILVLLIVIRIARVFQLKRKFPSRTVDNISFINTNIKQAPFSFLNNLFWRKDIPLTDEVGKQIYQHEMAHIRQRHSLDKLLIQLIRAIFWMNPVYYFVERELLLIHEYMADQRAVREGDGEAFARMLLATQLSGFAFEPAHPLSYSSIKKRLHMITNSHKPKYSYLRRLLFLPLLFTVTFVFALRAHQKKVADETKNLEQLLALQTDNTSSSAQQMKGNIEFSRVADTVRPDSLKHKVQFATKGKKPLVILDGKKQPADYDMDQLDANSIQSIDVLKDGYATRTYGDQAKDGVVLITTKAYAAKQKQQGLRPVTVVSFLAQGADNEPSGQGDQATEAQNNGQKEIVVVGYGTASKAKSNGDSLSGKAIGIRSRDGATSANQPLYILDGKPITTAEMKAISPNEIEKIDVLKDKSATAIYGSKAKNGVVLITTKEAGAKLKKASDQSDSKEFTQVQVEPKFPGGKDAWAKYLERHTRQGVPVEHHAPVGTYKVTVSFLVDKEGNISEVKAISKDAKDYGTAEEAVRVVKSSGKWLPARQNGRPVGYRQKQEIIFSVMK